MKLKQLLFLSTVGALTILHFQNCNRSTPFAQDQGFSATEQTASSEEQGSPRTDVICDPLSGAGACTIGQGQGLTGHLYYLESSMFNSELKSARLDDYFSRGRKIDTPLIMSQFNIPNQSFESGFLTGRNANGENVYARNSRGEKLVEYFAIKVSGNLMVSDAADEGLYQFKISSDDGSRLLIDGHVVINNDAVQSETTVTSNQLILLQRDEKNPIEIHYFQGPRYNIALKVSTRKCRVQASATVCTAFDPWKILPASMLSH